MVTHRRLGSTAAQYEILRPLGAGGMGVVYLARDGSLGRQVALKFLPDSLERNETARKRFLREARSAAAIDHPYSCKIYEVGEADGRTFIAMEYVEGHSLEETLRDGPLAHGRALEIATEVAEALDKAHRQGIVHRDLKPANVMLTPEGHAKVMDFGLAKPLPVFAGDGDEEETRTLLTRAGGAPGTPAYMSPEQIRGQPVGPRSDVFSFGILLYEMLEGRHPFRRAGEAETLAAILAEDPPLLRDDLPRPLRQLLLRCLAKNPGERYSGFAELRKDLQARRADSPLGGGAGRRLGRLAVAASLGLVLAVVALLVSGELPQDERAPTRVDVAGLQADGYESRARSLMQNFSHPEDLRMSIEAWQQVGRLRPAYAPAPAGRATARALIAWNSSPDPRLLELAEQEARQALELDPELADAYLALSIVSQLRGLLDAAQRMSDRAFELAPEDPWVLMMRARFLMDQFGDYVQAESLARRATDIDPAHYPSWFQLGWAQMELERYQEAEQSFYRAIALRPDFGAGFFGLGFLFSSTGQFERARDALDEALDIDPDSVQALHSQGVAHHYLGARQRALDYFRALVDRNPRHPLATHALVLQAVEYDALAMPAERDAALAAAETAAKLVSEHWWGVVCLAGAAAERGDRGQALGWLRQAQDKGLHSAHYLLLDPALEPLRDDAEFRQIVAGIRRSSVPRES